MKYFKLKFLTFFLTALLAFGVGWAAEETVTYTFTSKSWTATPENWTGSSNGSQFNTSATPLGVQILQSLNGLTVTSPKSYNNISKIVITYSSSSKAAGYIRVYIGDELIDYQPVEKSKTMTPLTYTVSNKSGIVKFQNLCSSNSYGINSIAITYDDDAQPSTDPKVKIEPNPLTINDNGGTFTINGSHLPDGGLGVNHESGNPYCSQLTDFSYTLSSGLDYFSASYSDEKGNYVENGTATIYYTGRELSATGVMGFASGTAGATATVNYVPDIYILGDYGNGWNYNDATNKMTLDGDTYTATVTFPANSYFVFARKLNESGLWNDGRSYFGPSYNNWPVNGTVTDQDLDLNNHYVFEVKNAGEYIITINPATKKFSITSSNVANLTEANAYTTGEQFKFNGRVVVTYRQGKNLWIRDIPTRGGSTTAGYIYGASNGADFAQGDALKAGWTATKSVYNGLDEFTSAAGLQKDGEADCTPEVLTAINPATDVNKYVEFKGVSQIVDTEGNVVPLRDQFNTGFTFEEGKTYDIVGIVSYYNGLQFYPIKDLSLNVSLESDTKIATVGETIPVTVTVENAEGDYTVTYKFGETGTENTLTGNVINVTSETAGTVELFVTVTNNGATATTSETYTFRNPDAPLATDFVLVTNISQLEDGKQIIIADKNTVTTTSALSTNQKANNRGVVNLTVAEGLKIIANDDTEIMTLEKDGDYWYLRARKTAGYLYAPGGDNYLRTEGERTTNAQTSISIADDNIATIEFNTAADQRYLRYNSTSDLYSCYKASSSMKPVYIYVEKPSAPVPVDPELAFDEETPTTVYVGDVVTLTVNNVPEGATLSFTCDPEGAVTFGENGKATFNTAGNVTITANTTATDEYTTGTATCTISVEARPFLLADEAVDLETIVGTPVSKTFTVMGENLKGDITLTMTESNVFTITPATIAKADMTEEGVEVTVTYNPTAVTGEDFDEATVTIKSTDADDVKVNLTGMATLPDPELTVSTETLEMGTNPTGTFTVTGQHLTENVTLTVTVTEGEAKNFEISPATIIPDEEGKVSQEVTVTYKGNSTEDEYATITVKSGIAKKEVIVTARVLPTPQIIAEPENLTMTAVVGQTPATATFTVMASDLRGDITLTMSESDVFTINPATITKADMTEDGVEVTVTYTPTQAGNDNATITIASEAAESATVTLAGTATVPEVVAMPTFSLVAGSYTGAQQLTINCATEGATISYSTDGGQTWTVGNTVNVDKDMTIMAKASKDGYTISETATAAYIIDIPEELPTITPFKGYYQIKNNGNGMYANIAGRKTLNFTDAPADKAGTVIYVETNDKGQVQSIRSQAADLQGYANRAMRYVPKIVELVADKLNADGEGNLLGHEGLEKIMEKFNESFDHHLYVEQAGEGWRLYGKTPSMQPVVEFYRENTAQVEAKLPMLESFINSALNKLKEKIGGQSVFTEFSLHDIWQKMGGTLTEPTDDASTMAFYREVLNNKNYVWDFAYQTAMIYVNNVKNHPRWSEVEAELGEYAQYIDKIDQIRPDFKYYVVQENDKPDFISEGNVDIKNNAARTIWTMEERSTFTVNIPANAETTCDKFQKATTLYTDFAYELPEGVTAYKVTDVVEGTAITEALSGVIPAQTPVLLMAAEAGDKVLTLSTEAGTAVTGNLLVGPDYLINTYKLTTPQVEGIFNMIKEKLGEDFYNTYVKEYEHLMYLNSGTVNNKYFWGLKEEDVKKCTYLDEEGVKDYVVRGLEGNAFVNNKQVKTNKAFLVSEDAQIISLNKRGDVNHDGKVNIKDVTDLIDRLLDPENTVACPICSDFNLSGKVDIKDVTDLIDVLLTAPYAEQENPSTGSQD